jgi:alpha-galactosidase
VISALVCLFSQFLMSQEKMTPCMAPADTVIAIRVPHEISLNAQRPAAEWESAAPMSFCEDWRGANPDPARQTEVRVLWMPTTLYLRFVCRYREVFVFEDSEANGWRFHLWERDVAEAFLQPDPSRPPYYKEFEVSPNGMWIDLDVAPPDVFPNGLRDLKSGLTRSVWLDAEHHTWVAELAIPMKALITKFEPSAVWRANFYRVEGPQEPRFYSAWQPTHSAQPNFHVPEAFGKLRFSER